MKKKSYLISSLLLITACTITNISQEILGYAAKRNYRYFSASVKKMSVGTSYLFKVAGVRSDGKAIQWFSSNPEIAKVTKRGKVVALKKGKVTIKAVITKSGESISQKLKIVKKEIRMEETGQDSINFDNSIEEIENNLNLPENTESSYQEQPVESNLVKNLSKQANKSEVSFNAIGFTEWSDINDFCYSMFQKTLKDTKENPVVSPLSAYLALQLIAEGAENTTKEEFNALLGKDMISTRIFQLMQSFSSISGNTKLSIADSIWLDDNFEAKASWLSNMVSTYNAEIFQTKLSSDAARTGMNNWVSNKTRGFIPSIFDHNLSENARLVLMNTIYLKAKWKHVFEAYQTYQRDFTNENGKKCEVEFMNQYDVDRKYFKTEEADGIVLPYDDNRLVMLAIRPQAGQTVREFVQDLTQEKISEYLENAEDTYMTLHLPRFTIDYSIKMNEILKQMGLTEAFDGKKADFTGIGRSKDGENIFIDEVMQKVKIQVDGEGTEAAAVTEITMTATGALVEKPIPMDLDFNEPFVYIIVDTRTPFGKQTIPLFMGVVTELNCNALN